MGIKNRKNYCKNTVKNTDSSGSVVNSTVRLKLWNYGTIMLWKKSLEEKKSKEKRLLEKKLWTKDIDIDVDINVPKLE